MAMDHTIAMPIYYAMLFIFFLMLLAPAFKKTGRNGTNVSNDIPWRQI